MSTAIEPIKNNLPAPPEPDNATVDLANFAAMPFQQLEAAFSLEMDRIGRLMQDDPLEGLSQYLGLMLAINGELLKAMAPALVHNAQRKSDSFMLEGRITEDRREGSRMMVSFLRVQEATAKLGVARVKVNDEKARRDR